MVSAWKTSARGASNSRLGPTDVRRALRVGDRLPATGLRSRYSVVRHGRARTETPDEPCARIRRHRFDRRAIGLVATWNAGLGPLWYPILLLFDGGSGPVTISRLGRIQGSALAVVPSPAIRFDPQSVVHGNPELLLASEIPLGRLNGDMSEQELDLVQFATREVA